MFELNTHSKLESRVTITSGEEEGQSIKLYHSIAALDVSSEILGFLLSNTIRVFHQCVNTYLFVYFYDQKNHAISSVITVAAKQLGGSRTGNHFKTICGYEFGALKILYT